MNTHLEVKRSIMLANGFRLTDQALDEMELVEAENGMAIKIKGNVSLTPWKMVKGSCE